MKNSECTIEQYRGAKLVRSFTPTGDPALPWRMTVNGKSYLRNHGWVLSKILPTLVDSSPITTKVLPNDARPLSLVEEKLDKLVAIGTSLEPLVGWARELQEGYEGFDNSERARRYEAVQEELRKAARALEEACLHLQEELPTKPPG